jgi:hypothetical protein
MLETLGAKVEPGVEHIQSGSELLAIILSYHCRESKNGNPSLIEDVEKSACCTFAS